MEVFGFPAFINEKAARVVAGVVMAAGIVTLATSAHWLLAVLAYGFWARVLTGPTLSPLGRLASRVVAPRLGPPRDVPGPPKRFAQAIGAALTTVAAVAALGFGNAGLADGLTVALVAAAGLESLAGYCVGCKVFALLMRAGLIPAEVCAACADLSAPRPTSNTA